MIEILFNPADSEFSNLLISLDRKFIDYSIVENKIVMSAPIELGMHVLRLQLVNIDSKLDIADVLIDGSSLRQTLFFSFVEEDSTRTQPATCVWKTTQEWVLPFMNPVSHWIGLLGEKLRKDALGTDLSQDYRIYIPESYILNDKFPPALADFFKFNFDCVILHKDEVSLQNLPYELYTKEINIDGIYDEIYRNIDLIRSKLSISTGTQHFYNQRDDKNFDYGGCWFATTICKIREGEKNYLTATPEMLPRTYALFDSLNLDYDVLTIAVSPPGTYAYTHIDRLPVGHNEKFIGCKKLYIPLNYPAGSAIKVRNVGILPQVPTIINAQYYSHAVVNDSDETRIVLSATYNYKLQ